MDREKNINFSVCNSHKSTHTSNINFNNALLEVSVKRLDFFCKSSMTAAVKKLLEMRGVIANAGESLHLVLVKSR